jgi:hypothetical protein
MLISHRHRFIYLKTAKTASTSVEAFFEPSCMPEGEWVESGARDEYESEAGVIGYRGLDPQGKKWYNHMPAAKVRELIGEEKWNAYFKFCVVRNPWDKAISAFEHFGRNHALPGGLHGLLYRFRTPGLQPEQRRFLHYLQARRPPIDRDKYVIDGRVCVDYLIRFEDLRGGIREVCEKLGLPCEESRLGNHKSGLRRKEATASSLYTLASRELVAQYYAFELEHFGYTFPEATKTIA